MGPTALLPLRRKACCGFCPPWKFIASAGFESANYGYTGKHANHYTSEATILISYFYQSLLTFVG
jgi:hypothetical protein